MYIDITVLGKHACISNIILLLPKYYDGCQYMLDLKVLINILNSDAKKVRDKIFWQ